LNQACGASAVPVSAGYGTPGPAPGVLDSAATSDEFMWALSAGSIIHKAETKS